MSFGDGRRSAGQVVWATGQAYAVLAEHAYARRGTYRIVVQVRRDETRRRVDRSAAVIR